MGFDRGFKSWSERTALILRSEMRLLPTDPLSPRELAEFFEVVLWTPRDVSGLQPEVYDQLVHKDPFGWSAISMVLSEVQGLIIYNPKKSKGRQASDITHELAHFILDHKPSTLILSEDGTMAMRTFDQKQEDEANWLAWVILLPREALMFVKRKGLTNSQIATMFGVSESLVKFRMNVSGVQVQIRARRRA